MNWDNDEFTDLERLLGGAAIIGFIVWALIVIFTERVP